MPQQYKDSKINAVAERVGIKTFCFSLSEVDEKPISLRQQRWNLEDDTGCEEWLGFAFAKALENLKWDEFILVPVENLLVEPSAVKESLNLFYRENLEICFAGERMPGAGWTIVKTDVIKALEINHKELMRARGAIAWALRKPLYPFKTGIYHCPRVRPALNCDLRANSTRNLAMYQQVEYENFFNPSFSYEEWLGQTNWLETLTFNMPQTIHLEPSSLCNADCFDCPHSSLTRENSNMSFDLFEKFIETINDISELRFIFSGIGEPLLNRDLSKMLEKTAPASTMLVTSLQKELGDNFPFESLDQIRISLDALEAESFSENRSGCNWNNIEKFIAEAYKLKLKSPETFPEIGVSYVRHGKNDANALNFLRYWKKVCTPVFNEWFFRWPFSLTPEKIQWFQILGENSFLGKINKNAINDYLPVKRRVCRHALLSATVLSNGKVIACPFDVDGKFVLGNIKEQGLPQIWQSEKAQKFRQAHILSDYDSLPEMCRECIDWYHNL
jgi:radical SAM protein with 4Fe4S-binding SPASM domain